MADSTINIKFDTGAGSDNGSQSSSNQYLISVLDKLNNTLSRLSNMTNAKDINTNPSNNVGAIGSINDLNDAKRRYQADYERMNTEFRNMGNKIGSLIGTSIMTGIAATTIRAANNYASSTIGRATAQGSFAASAIAGNANQNIGNYVSSLYDTERIRRVTQRNLEYEGGFGTGGALAGILAGAGAGAAVGSIGGPIGGLVGALGGAVTGAVKGGAFGGSMGYAAGAAGAAQGNAEITQKMLLQSAIASRNASASISQWQTGFSRFGLKTGNETIVPSDVTHGSSISVPLATDFQKRYGGSQNYNNILNGIVPNLNTNPMDRSKTGDLNTVAQNLLKAGFAAGDFAKITQQSAQYTAITGRNIQQYSEDIKIARAKFGESFDSGSLQTMLNLMSIGYSKNQAQNIAYQSQFNPGMAGNVTRFANIGFSEFYKNKAIGEMLGIDINRSLAGGAFIGKESTKNKINKELNNLQNGGEYGPTLMLLNQAGFTPASLRSLLQNKAAVNESYSSQGLNSDMSPGQKIGQQIIDAINDGLKNVQNMNVTATNVTVTGNVNQSNGFNWQNISTSLGSRLLGSPPAPYGASSSPTNPN
jgi:hypothetical protein